MRHIPAGHHYHLCDVSEALPSDQWCRQDKRPSEIIIKSFNRDSKAWLMSDLGFGLLPVESGRRVMM